MLNIKPELWTKDGGERFVVLSLHDFEKIQELLEDAGLARILRRAKQKDPATRGISLDQMKRRLGIPVPRSRRAGSGA